MFILYLRTSRTQCSYLKQEKIDNTYWYFHSSIKFIYNGTKYGKRVIAIIQLEEKIHPVPWDIFIWNVRLIDNLKPNKDANLQKYERAFNQVTSVITHTPILKGRFYYLTPPIWVIWKMWFLLNFSNIRIGHNQIITVIPKIYFLVFSA